MKLSKKSHYLLVICAIAVAVSIVYYFIIYLPKLENDKKQELISSCILKAKQNYNSTWAQTCTKYAQDQDNGYKRCLNSSLSGGICSTIWHTPDSTPNCNLPDSYSKSLKNDYNDTVAQCNNL